MSNYRQITVDHLPEKTRQELADLTARLKHCNENGHSLSPVEGKPRTYRCNHCHQIYSNSFTDKNYRSTDDKSDEPREQ